MNILTQLSKNTILHNKIDFYVLPAQSWYIQFGIICQDQFISKTSMLFSFTALH